jgi:TPR repeat protein
MRLKNTFIFLLCVMLALPTSVAAQQEESQVMLPEISVQEERPLPSFSPSEVPEKIKQATEGNDPVAQYTLGVMLYYGKSVERDVFKAEKYITMAAKNDYAPAQTQMGYIHADKNGHTLALEWFNKAAAQNEPWANFRLAQYYEQGINVFKNYEKARKYYEVAADADIMNAVLKLGTYYQYGIGVEKDVETAIAYYEYAADKGSEDFKLHVSLLLVNLLSELANNPESQEVHTKEKIFKWRLKAAEMGDLDSIVTTAEAYFEGIGTPVDYEKSIAWYKKATEHGHLISMVKLGQIYANGMGTEINFTEAAKWYRRAAENGNVEAAWNLANLYENGLGVTKDPAEAQKWYYRADMLKQKRR